jgi:hypothetical protein
MAASEGDNRKFKRQSGMSYKFQRLREKIRMTIESGEIDGKLPGERTLARRFHVNAKTLSKALTDLAAEGVLDRSIGRGTYVKGTAPVSEVVSGRWLILCEDGDEAGCIIPHLRKHCPDLLIIPSVLQARPSFLNQFATVVDLSPSTPDEAIRKLLVRNMPLVVVDREPQGYSVDSVLVDISLGVSRMARDLLLAGHRRIGAIEPRDSDVVTKALRRTVERYGSEASVETASANEVASLVESGVTALICGSTSDAWRVRNTLDGMGGLVPRRVSLTAVGYSSPEIPCSGYYVEAVKVADSVVNFLTDPPLRPVTLWLAGTWLDRGTMVPIGSALPLEKSAPLRVSGMPV